MDVHLPEGHRVDANGGVVLTEVGALGDVNLEVPDLADVQFGLVAEGVVAAGDAVPCDAVEDGVPVLLELRGVLGFYGVGHGSFLSSFIVSVFLLFIAGYGTCVRRTAVTESGFRMPVVRR